MRVHVDNLRDDGYTRAVTFERLVLQGEMLISITRSMTGPFNDDFVMTEEKFLNMLMQMGYFVSAPLVVGKRPISPHGQIHAMEDIRRDCGDECKCEGCR